MSETMPSTPADRQPRRDRHPHPSRLCRARHPHDRDPLRRGPLRPPPLQGGRGLSLGDGGNPVGVYLDIPRILEIAEYRRRAVYGYGFLSERADFAEAVTAGIQFVGPPASVCRASATRSAHATRRSKPASHHPRLAADRGRQAGLEFAREIGFPVMVKASGGGGGRGMRVRTPAEFVENWAARREAAAPSATTRSSSRSSSRAPSTSRSRSSPTSTARRPLFERDCSIQRHQKVVELAPAPDLSRAPRKPLQLGRRVRAPRRLSDHRNRRVRLRRRLLLHRDEPRVPVEHRHRGDHRRRHRGLSDPRRGGPDARVDGHRRGAGPATSRSSAASRPKTREQLPPGLRPAHLLPLPGGLGVRLDAGNAFPGAIITPYYDSLLAKLTTRGRDLEKPPPGRSGPSASSACVASRRTSPTSR